MCPSEESHSAGPCSTASSQPFSSTSTEAGKVEVTEFDAVWEGPEGESYLDELRDLHGYMMPYRVLDTVDQQRVNSAILDIIQEYSENGRVVIPTPILIAVASKG